MKKCSSLSCLFTRLKTRKMSLEQVDTMRQRCLECVEYDEGKGCFSSKTDLVIRKAWAKAIWS